MTQQILNFKNISEYFTQIDLISIIDVIIVIFIVWQILNLLSKSRALQIAKGLFFLYVLNIIGTIFNSILSNCIGIVRNVNFTNSVSNINLEVELFNSFDF